MPNVRNPRSAYEVACEWGVPLEDLLSSEKSKDDRLIAARKAYKEGVDSGLVLASPAPTGPSVDMLDT